jgi:hypothetical protein
MNGNFTKGLIIGGLVGVSLNMLGNNMKDPKVRKRMMRPGREFVRKTRRVYRDICDLLR